MEVELQLPKLLLAFAPSFEAYPMISTVGKSIT